MALQQLFTTGPLDADGTPQVSPEPTSLLIDDYSLAITTYHTTGGTAPTISGGVATTSEGTTASAVSYVRSTLPYYLRAGTYLRIAHIVTIESAVTSNNTRWWGYGQNQTTPSATAPVLNGAVWLVDTSATTSGALVAAIFSNGTKTVIPWTTTPTRDSNPHRYQIDYRQSVIYWSIDGVTVASRTMPQLAVAQGMYEIWGAANTATAPSAHTFQISSSSVADMGGNNRTISDGVNTALQATVKAGSTAAVAADLPLVVAFHPTSPLPAGTNGIGGVNYVSSVTGGGANKYATVTTASAFTGVIRTGAGNLGELTVSNVTSTAAYIKLYDATSATAGSGTPVATYRIAATGSAGDTINPNFGQNGKRFTTGIAFAVTGAASATDTTATVAGIQISASYT